MVWEQRLHKYELSIIWDTLFALKLKFSGQAFRHENLTVRVNKKKDHGHYLIPFVASALIQRQLTLTRVAEEIKRMKSAVL